MERLYSQNSNLTKESSYNGEKIRETNLSIKFDPSPGDEWYTVKEQDDLLSIARNKYKNSSMWSLIARANQIINPFELTIGDILLIPKDR